MLKKYVFLFVFVALSLFGQSVSADVAQSDNAWSYSFHLEYNNETLSPASETYTPVPVFSSPTENPNTTDYYGIIIGVQKNELSRFGFNTPKTSVAALGKSIFDISAPFFANADHVGFYTKKGEHLFDVSLKGSSYCNDNNTCNVEVGEDYTNCPNDCPPPPETIEQGAVPEKSELSTTTNAAITTETANPTNEGIFIQPSTTQEVSATKTKTTLIVLGIVFTLLLLVLWKLKGFRK